MSYALCVGHQVVWNDGGLVKYGTVSDPCGMWVYPENGHPFGLNCCNFTVTENGTGNTWSVSGEQLVHAPGYTSGNTTMLSDPAHTASNERMAEAIEKLTAQLEQQNNPPPPKPKKLVEVESVSDQDLLLILL